MTKDKGSKPIVAYKGFNKDMTCRDFQYEIGKSYKHDGEVKACVSGFHSCEYPLDVFNYYSPAESVFAVVEVEVEQDKYSDDSKIASEKITIKAAIDLPGLIKAAISYTTKRINPRKEATSENSGYRGAASNSGDWGVAAAYGYKGRAKSDSTGAIVLCYRNDEGEILHIRASKVGENGIKPDTWYELDANGDFMRIL